MHGKTMVVTEGRVVNPPRFINGDRTKAEFTIQNAGCPLRGHGRFHETVYEWTVHVIAPEFAGAVVSGIRDGDRVTIRGQLARTRRQAFGSGEADVVIVVDGSGSVQVQPLGMLRVG